MRISFRRILQVTLIFGALLVLNSLLFVLDRRRNSFTQEVPQFVSLRDPSIAKDGDRRASDNSGSDTKWGQSALINFLRPQWMQHMDHDRNKRSLTLTASDIKRTIVNTNPLIRTVFQPTSSPPVPLTKANRPTSLDDIFISVKTTKKFHKDRVRLILETWFLLAKAQTHFFTDSNDPELQQKIRGNMINTNCSSTHNRASLCCKMSVEYDTFITSGKRWFCHVDDDTYVNVPALVETLQAYNHTHDWYLGKPSLNHPIEKQDINNKDQRTLFWFATGGAGFCLSRAMALKMMPFSAGGKLWTVCDKIRLPDDCTVGFIIYYYLKKELTIVPNFHSHLEGLWSIKASKLEKQITFSYSRLASRKLNVVDVDGFSKSDDPTRFRSIHCALYPNLPECPRNR